MVSYRLSIMTIMLSLTIWPQFATECLRRSNQQWVGHFGAKFGEETVEKCKPDFNVIRERHRAVVCKRYLVDIFCRLSTMHERARQTDRQTNRPRNGNIHRNNAVTKRRAMYCNCIRVGARLTVTTTTQHGTDQSSLNEKFQFS